MTDPKDKLAEVTKKLEDKIRPLDGDAADLSWMDIARAFHLLDGMKPADKQLYLRHHDYKHLVNDCLIDRGSFFSDFSDFSRTQDVVAALAKEAVLPANERGNHELALLGSVDKSQGRLAGPDPCKAAIFAERQLLKEVTEPTAPPAPAPNASVKGRTRGSH